MSKSASEGKLAALHLLAAAEVKRVADYSSRGRQFEHLSANGLEAAWRQAYKDRAMNVWSAPALQRTDDIQSEFELRKLEPPHHLVESDATSIVKQMQADIEARFEEMTEEEIAEANASMMRDYRDMKRSES